MDSRNGHSGYAFAIDPMQLQALTNNLAALVEKSTGQGKNPIVLTSPPVRKKFKRLVEPVVPDLAVLSYNEIEQSVEIHSEGVLRL